MFFILTDGTYIKLNKNSFSEHSETDQNDTKRPFKVQRMFGHYFIVLDDALNLHEDEWFTMERLPSGKIVFDPEVLGR